MTNYEKAAEYLKKASVRGSVMGLSRIKKLLELLDNPQDSVKTIHVSGTNGKGSFSAMLSSVLYSSGYTVGVFSSPALTDYTDNFRINCQTISEMLFGAAILQIEQLAETMDEKPTEFEILTAAAFLIFRESNCDVCIVECGLGGDSDSTNVVSNPVLSVITNVQMDHCQILGSTISEIASHKAGIIKKGCPVLYGGNDSAIDVIRAKAEQMGSKLYRTNMERLSREVFGVTTCFDFGGYTNLELTLPGLYQTKNAANVLTALEILQERGFDRICERAVRNGLLKCRWKGRFEMLCSRPEVYFDGSHNPDGMAYTVESMKHYFGGRKAAVLIGIMADKDYERYAAMLSDVTDRIYAVTPDNPRALDCKELAEYFRKNGMDAEAYEDFDRGVREAFERAKECNTPLMALGTLYMYNDFVKALEPLAEKDRPVPPNAFSNFM